MMICAKCGVYAPGDDGLCNDCKLSEIVSMLRGLSIAGILLLLAMAVYLIWK